MKTRRLGLAVLALLLSGSLALAASPPRILVIYDMEGVSGIDREAMTDSRNPAYAEGRRFLTSDVNAAVRGLKAGGAGAVWVEDGHGSGNAEEPDLLLDQMDPRASFESPSSPSPRPSAPRSWSGSFSSRRKARSFSSSTGSCCSSAGSIRRRCRSGRATRPQPLRRSGFTGTTEGKEA